MEDTTVITQTVESGHREQLLSVPESAPWAPPTKGEFDYTIVRLEGNPPIPCDGCRSPNGPWFLAFYYGTKEQYERNESPLVFTLCSGCSTRVSKLVDLCTNCIIDPDSERVCDTCGKEYRRKAPGWKPPVAQEAVA